MTILDSVGSELLTEVRSVEAKFPERVFVRVRQPNDPGIITSLVEQNTQKGLSVASPSTDNCGACPATGR